MKNAKLYIIGLGFLIAGLLIGWVVKPNQQAVEMDHSGHDHDSGMSMNSEDSMAEVWTCSMHPQIRQDEPGICPICEMDLVPLDNSLANDDPTILRMSKSAAKLAQIETFIVGGRNSQSETTDDAQEIAVDGTIELDERTLKSQTAHLSGRIETMAVTFEGQYVSAGQQIATIFSTELLAASQELLTAAQFNDKVEGLKDAAAQKLKNWKITDAQITQILESGNPLETITIYADHSGYVLSKKLSQGDYVKQGQALYTTGSTSRLWLIFNVFETDLANVKKGNKVEFTTPSIPNKTFNSRINYIEPLLNSATRTAVVRAEIANSGNLLKPGMLIDGKIQGSPANKTEEDNNSVFAIPSSAVLWTGARSVVYVQLSDTEVPTFEFREVKVGNSSGKMTTVTSGISDGDEVVSEGAFSVDAAAQLNNNFSMMNRDVKVKSEMSGEAVPSYADETPGDFKSQLDVLVISYLAIKNALVETDAGKASMAASQFLEGLDKVDMTLLESEAHLFWMDQLNALKSHSSKIMNSEDVEDQRDQFDFLSQAMIKSLKAFGTTEGEGAYYVQYCPMAKDNQGADWISEEKEIRNPYFGDKMMKCGSVKLELN